MKSAKERMTEDGYWSGDRGASGVLPLAKSTGRLCLAWRNVEVHQGDCFGLLGGAVKDGMSPGESACIEMKEESGYGGPVKLTPLYIFRDGDFTYENFLGVVDSEFAFKPSEEHAWETDYIVWMKLEEILSSIEQSPGDYHPGILQLFENSKDAIRSVIGQSKRASTYPPKIVAAIKDFYAFMASDEEVDEGLALCTNQCKEFQKRFGGKIYGYYHDDNPTAELGESEGGHDFLIVDDRYLVDTWAGDFYNARDLYDLQDAKDSAEVQRMYGPRDLWKPVEGLEKASSHKMTPLQNPPDYVEGTNGWALHPDQRATG